MPSDTFIQLHAIIQGEVQGVGFRATAENFARQLGLGGTVRNQTDGSVELIAHGTHAKLEKLIMMLRQKYGHRIVNIETTFSPFEGRPGIFKIII